MAGSMRCLLASACLGAALGTTADASYRANPIRRVVSMLQMMQEKITAEGKKEEGLWEKFECFCKSGGADLSASISAAEAKIAQDTSSLEAAQATASQLKTELAQHKSDRSEAKDALAEATALREKEAATYSAQSSEHQTNIAALGKAIDALSKGMAGFLQTSAADRLRQLTIDAELSTADRDMLTAFLSVDGSQGYAPASGQIVGILKQMKSTMEKDLAELTAAEESAIKDFKELSAAKTKEIEANGAAIEAKTGRSGKVGLEIVELKEDVDDTSKALADDQKFLADLDSSCATKKKEWEERSKTRAEELLALAETVKLLNDDDSLELFKKTLSPSPSLMQVQVRGSALRSQAIRALRAGRTKGDPRMDLVMLALMGKSRSFDKVIGMIDSMVSLLGREQADDDGKKGYCLESLDKAEDEKKALDQTVADLEKAMEDAKASIETLGDEISALTSGIEALDKSVAEATETRKSQNAEYKETMAADKAAKELIGVAKNRLYKFYSPGLYKAPPKRELSAEDRIFVNNGGTAPPTEAPGGIAGTGITYLQAAPVLAQVSSHRARGTDGEAPPPPPETWDAYAKKGQESNGVLAMLDMLVADLDKEMQQMEVDEKDSQAEYETFMENAKAKRAADAKLIADKGAYKAELESELQKTGLEHKSTLKQGMGKAEEIRDLHLECDWILSNYEARKQARAGEVESLKSAKAVLSGADYAFVQRARRVQLRGAGQQ